VLAICATGARFIGTARARQFAEDVFERIELTLQQRWKAGIEQLDLLRVAILFQCHAVFSGESRLLANAFALQGSVIAHARRLGLFSEGGPCDFALPVDLPLDDVDQLNCLWKRWIQSDIARRSVLSDAHHL
jgi:hypothetical protein